MYSRPKKQKQVLIDRQILAIHRVIADKVLQEQQYLEQAHQVMTSRYKSGLLHYGSYLLWESILAHSHKPEIFKALLLAEDSRTASLRRATIFTGVLTEEERESAIAT